MFRITKDPSSGSPIQYLAKITGSATLYSGLHTCTTGRICCHNTNYVHVNRHDTTILVILAKYCMRLPDDGSFVIMLGHFEIFYNFNYIYKLYIRASVG